MSKRGINKAMVSGYLGQDPELRHTGGGRAVVNVSVATSESWKDKNTGEQQERTEWHRIVLFGKAAEVVAQWMKKGDQAYFEGALATRKWQDQAGNDRYSTEIVADEFQFMSGKGDQPARSQAAPSQAPAKPVETIPVESGAGFDDIPF